ncbi:MAG: TonB-dependent receptor plug domain-containing protein, partial [Ginsengibacter sp.]
VKCQVEKEPLPDNDMPVIKINSHNRIYGKVLDRETKRPLPSVSVQVIARMHNRPANQMKDSVIAAMLSAANGDFNFENIPAFDSLQILISAVDYNIHSDYFSFAGKNADANTPIEQDLGNIEMSRVAKKLEAVTIVMQKPALQMGIDKKIFDVNKSISSKGGTAIDVMKNIPSVSVDVDGNVELRNSTPTIFIDGRPTILTLDQIPSDNIDRIELITNPSAKYDASTTGGIINIILKKNKRTGLNGLVSAAAGTQGLLSGNANLNLRQGKLNFFVSGGYHGSDGKSNSESYRQDKTNGIVDDYFNQYSKNERNRKFASVRFGLDYFIDNRNTLTLSQGLVQGRFANDEWQDQ